MGNIIQHIAMIMDGNGRWAKHRGLPRSAGHKQGLKSVEMVVDWCVANSIPCLSLFVFSTENWLRPQAEIDQLFALAKRYLSNIHDLCKKGYRVIVSGSMDKLPDDLVKSIVKVQHDTAYYSKFTINLCINYGGRQEIVDVCNHLANTNQAITQQNVDKILFAHLPAPDIVVRTGGRMRLSNFLLYQSAYAELFFLETLWPDITAIQLDSIVRQFAQRTRNYGGLPNE